MPKYSVIVPVYNRPIEVKELLESLVNTAYTDLEVLVIEDGSSIGCKEICDLFSNHLDIYYWYKENSGQGFTRNFGFERAKGEYFIQLDSDALVPPHYFTALDHSLKINNWDAFGGPDMAHPSFSPFQKAVNYAMTSVFTTGGIRGKSKNLGGKYTPRSFNFGLKRAVWEKVGGYIITRKGEDIEYSFRIIQADFKVGLVPEAFIYHKRRTSMSQFYRQLHFFGTARINISRFFPEQLKAVHFFPLLFFLSVCSLPGIFFLNAKLALLGVILLTVYFLLLMLDAFFKSKEMQVALWSVPVCFIQLFAYGHGFLEEIIRSKIGKNRA